MQWHGHPALTGLLLAGLMLGSVGCAGTASSTEPFNVVDVRFVRRTVAHHEQTAEIAHIAERRSNDHRIQHLAASIASEQTGEMRRLRAILTRWGLDSPLLTGTGRGGDIEWFGTEPAAEIARLRHAPARRFDRVFLTMLAAHEHEAVELADFETFYGASPLTVRMAENSRNARSLTIDEVTHLLGEVNR